MGSKPLASHLILLVGILTSTIGFLLGFRMPLVGLPMMIISLGPCVFLNAKAILAMNNVKSPRARLRLWVMIDLLGLDSSVVAMGFLLAIGDFEGFYEAFIVFVLAAIVGLTFSNPPSLRILRDLFEEARAKGKDSSPTHRAQWNDFGLSLGALSIPLSLNRYVYALDNPMRYVDPTGRAAIADNGGGGCSGVDIITERVMVSTTTEEMGKKLEAERKRRLLDSIPETARLILSEYLSK